jgi:hypothetical protein
MWSYGRRVECEESRAIEHCSIVQRDWDSLARSQLKRGKSAVEAVEQWHERGRKSVTEVEAIDEERRGRDDGSE